MRRLLAVDTDATCDTGTPPGPVPASAVLKLASRHEVWSIGRRLLGEKLGIPHVGTLIGQVLEGGRSFPGGKGAALRALALRYPMLTIRVAVDDDPADYDGDISGWTIQSPAFFADGLDELLD